MIPPAPRARLRHVALVAAALTASACGSTGGGPDSAGTDEEPHWSYQGVNGPAAWGSLADDYHWCIDGTAQSPIAIDSPAEVPLPDLHFAYRTTAAEIHDTGHTEQVRLPEGSSLVLNGVRYGLEQLHYHAPSEHTVGGRSFPVEFHFVHRADDGAVAVVAVMAVSGAENPAWEPIVERLPTGGTAAIDELDVGALLPGDVATTRYEGSLTTPPCSEGVHWNVLDAGIALSRGQIDALTSHYVGNNRPPQPRNGRFVAHDATRGD